MTDHRLNPVAGAARPGLLCGTAAPGCVSAGGTPNRTTAEGRRATTIRAFTLTEMIVVIAIIVLLIGIAIPAVRALTGNRNVGAALNQISAIIGQARQDALALQTVHGVVFYLDPNTDRVYAMYVQSVTPPTGTTITAQVWLDTVPNREQMALPNGVGVQTIANPPYPSTALPDRYMGFNPSAGPCKFGGVILFDANGRLISQTYCLLCNTIFGGGSVSNGVQSGTPLPNTTVDPSFTGTYPQSQFGLVLFDRDAYLNQGYTDGNYVFDPNVTSTTQLAQDGWLDTNSTPVLVNRYNGTLIKGE